MENEFEFEVILQQI